MISKDKTYRTRDGREVRIYATDGDDPYPVHGAMKDYDDKWMSSEWTKDGCISSWSRVERDSDLIEAKPRFRIERWVNVYEGQWSEFPSRERAMRARCTDCLATKRIIIEGTEGEDDEEAK